MKRLVYSNAILGSYIRNTYDCM